MRSEMSCVWNSVRTGLFVLLLAAVFTPPTHAAKVKLNPSNWGHEAGEECVSCHKKASAGVVSEWDRSAHAEAGVNCMDCHQASADEVDAFEHEGQVIATIVSPLDCARCHTKEFDEQQGSVHAQAVLLAEGHKSVLGEMLGGTAITASGCDQCHGSVVKVRGDGQLDPLTWPNSGIGRINPDGSRGSCSSCHGRHRFSKAQARSPEACIRCHANSKSPDQSVFAASKHGMAYSANLPDMNLAAERWQAGMDYSAAPTCVTCHMGAAGKVKSTHDVGMRSAWKLYGPVSEKQYLVMFEDGSKRELPTSADAPGRGEEFARLDGSMAKVKFIARPERRRQIMSAVCLECHSKRFANDFMKQFDQTVELFNDKFARPAQTIMLSLYDAGKLSEAPFDEPIEFTYWSLWHDQGAALRHGAAMASPSHVAIDGMQALARQFYAEFIPEARRIAAEQADSLVDSHLRESELHPWLAPEIESNAAVMGITDSLHNESAEQANE